MFELSYSRKNIVRTVAIGFMLGSLVLSTGGLVITLGYAFLSHEPDRFQYVTLYLLWFPLLALFGGILLGWVVRLGLGVHAFWSYKATSKTLEMVPEITPRRDALD